MKIILVRHGETDWNKINKLQGGGSDIELNSTGISQAELTAHRLKDEKIDVIYSSPMKRALKTAEIIAKEHDMKIIIDKDLHERYYGDLEGTQHGKLSENMIKAFVNNEYEQRGIETVDKFHKRVSNFWKKAFEKHFGKTIVVVSHSSTSKMLLSVIQEIDFEEIRSTVIKKNASISIIEFDENKKIKYRLIGDHSHLDELI